MRIIHTSDWHLGHELYGFKRDVEHDAFLSWLYSQLVELGANALILTGDVYDGVNPPVEAQQKLYRFIRLALDDLPNFQFVIIGGNHDSPGRLELPKHLLDPQRIHLVGAMPREAGRAAVGRTLIKLHDDRGIPRVVCAAVPYLRPGDLPLSPSASLLAEIYRDVADAANTVAAGLPLIVTGHLHISGGAISDLGGRIVIGGEEAVSAAIFPASIGYVALGHLHKPQAIPGSTLIRYAGSPLPLSVTERDYEHSIVVIDIDVSGKVHADLRAIPRTVSFLRVPGIGAATLDIVEKELGALAIEDPGQAYRPFLEIAVQLPGPEPDLRQRIEAALAGKPVRLTRIIREAAVRGSASAVGPELSRGLDELRPEEVFRQRYSRDYDGDLPEEFDEVYAVALAPAEDGAPE